MYSHELFLKFLTNLTGFHKYMNCKSPMEYIRWIGYYQLSQWRNHTCPKVFKYKGYNVHVILFFVMLNSNISWLLWPNETVFLKVKIFISPEYFRACPRSFATIFSSFVPPLFTWGNLSERWGPVHG